MQPPGTSTLQQCLDQLAMYTGTVTFVLFALFSAIVLVASNPIPGFKKPNKRASATLKFEGCFGDSVNSILPSAQKYESSDNINHDCVDKCAEGGYAISSTKGTACYCTNDLPLPRLRKASDPKASGTDGPCSTTCPGASIAGTNTPCVGEECCGGPNAYSVYLSGEIDVLKQLLRRITASQTIGYDDAHIKKACEEISKAAGYTGISLYLSIVACQTASYYAVSACGTTITGNQITSIQKCTLTTFLKIKKVEYTCENLASLPDKHVELEVVSLERLIESEDPINEELATNYDIVSDNSHGTTDLTVSKSYQVSTSFSESWSTRHGFDFKITIGVETEVGTIFAKAKNKFELTTGYSFTSTYSKTEGTAISEKFSVKTVAAPGTKVITRFFKSQAPVQVNWRADILANGYVHVIDILKVVGDKTLVSLISDAKRRFFAFGTYDFGDRKMMIARSQTYDRYGNLISEEEDTKSVD